ncbi:MAG: hypothetical protein GX241_03405 [Ruminococcaceae bacterium]|nr:hypothetical protein [Oscillospiraceae bacterium]
MTDLHCHILPAIDDGAMDEKEAIALLKEEAKQGVTQIVFTPHFNDSISVDDFITLRQNSLKRLNEAIENKKNEEFSFRTKLGAEVHYSENLKNIDLAQLCFTGTCYLLLELPFEKEPSDLEEMIEYIVSLGIIPILAHVERYSYLIDNPRKLKKLIKLGALSQANLGAIWRNDDLTLKIVKLINMKLIHVVATDAHSKVKRPVNFLWGLHVLSQHIKPQKIKKLQENADKIFNNIDIRI